MTTMTLAASCAQMQGAGFPVSSSPPDSIPTIYLAKSYPLVVLEKVPGADLLGVHDMHSNVHYTQHQSRNSQQSRISRQSLADITRHHERTFGDNTNNLAFRIIFYVIPVPFKQTYKIYLALP